MILPAPLLAQLTRLAAQKHDGLKGFVLANAALWQAAAVRRTAREGLAVLAAMLRRLLHLLAWEVVLAPLRERTAPLPLTPLALSRARRLRFRLIEPPRPRPRRTANPHAVPDTPQLAHALVLERLARLAAVYRARHQIARRLARRVQVGRAPLAPAPLPLALAARLHPGFLEVLDLFEASLGLARQRAPP